MAVAVAAAFLSGALVFFSAPFWGASVRSGDRWAASILTTLVGAALAVLSAGELIPFLVALLVIAAVVDSRHRVIPNRIVVAGLLWALAQHATHGGWQAALWMAAGTFFFFLAIHVVSHGGLGMGDVKFSLMLAFALGYPAALVALVVAIWVAGVYAGLSWLRHHNRYAAMALGPFLAFGGVIGLLDLLH